MTTNLSTESESSTGPGIAMSKFDLITELLNAVGTSAATPVQSEDEFWKQFALANNIPPATTSVDTARAIFSSIGEPWEEDYEQDGDEVALAAIESLHARFAQQKADAFGESGLGFDDDDDEAIVAGANNFYAQRTDFSVSTLMEMVDKQELVLNPEWQRNFVWTTQKMRRLIESVFLGLPLPSLLLYHDNTTGKIFVIDGRQRLETLYRFRAKKENKGEAKIRFRTFPSSTDGWKEDQLLHPVAGKYYDQLPLKYKSTFDITSVVCIVFKQLPLKSLYQIFKRYNTGAVALNPAEIRNAVYQSTPLHQMMYRLAGEQGTSKYLDDAEKQASLALRSTMKRKIARYGAYDFIGRFYAFRYMTTGSVAKATNDFMEKHQAASTGSKNLDKLRQDFIDSFNAVLRWYDTPFVKSESEPVFHAFLATIQMVTTSHALELIKKGKISEQAVRAVINGKWKMFAEDTTAEKQNSTLFWKAQKDWLDVITASTPAT